MTGPRVVGIDLSLTSTGLADTDGRTHRIRTKKAVDGVPETVERLDRIVNTVMGFVLAADPELVVIEGPSYASTGGQQHTRGGLWWIAATRLVEFATPVLVVTPAQRAMYATGSGSAGKDEVLAAAIRRYPVWDITGNDVGDAVVLACIGARLLGHPVEESLPASHLRALNKLALPTT